MKKTIVFIAIVLLLFGCLEQNNPIIEEQSIAVQFMKSADIDVASAKCRVSADDMDTLEVDLNVSPIMISGEIGDVPYGDDRLFEIMCYNSDGYMNYYGSSLVDINSLDPVVNIVLYQVDSSANVTIRGTFGDPEETEEKIAFVADWEGDHNIYIMDTDGTNIKQLTTAEGYENYPRISPDRSEVLFFRGIGDGHPQPYLVDIETLEETHITPLSSYDPQCMSWHPDGNSIVFHSGYNSTTANIYKYDFSSETVTPLIENSSTNWVPLYVNDGENLLYYSNITGTYKAYIANPDGSNPVMILPDSGGEEKLPNMSPVNNNLILIAGRDYSPTSYSQWGLFLIDRSDSSVTNIISTNGVDESWPVWSPNGEKIVYERNSGGNHGIYIINPDGTENTVLIDTPSGSEENPHWR
jgi:TolB protein